MPPRIKKTHV